jgi:hypothetical protein
VVKSKGDILSHMLHPLPTVVSFLLVILVTHILFVSHPSLGVVNSVPYDFFPYKMEKLADELAVSGSGQIRFFQFLPFTSVFEYDMCKVKLNNILLC